MDSQDELFDEEIVEGNKEILDDMPAVDPSSIVVYSRDWTVQTIDSQIDIGNIDLNPKFQRRNAWNDEKRSNLIESLIVGYPVPEIVLAEHPTKKKSFIVIDGKQRLLTIAGFIRPEKYSYWFRDKLGQLKTRTDLTGLSYEELKSKPDAHRAFQNADLRCTVIANYSDVSVLYDIFYRLNTGSVPLSSQELRQVLNKGEFADYLIQVTDSLQPIHKVLGLEEPDRRLKDAETILRLIAFGLFPEKYQGNLQKFLNEIMTDMNANWAISNSVVQDYYQEINKAIGRIENALEKSEHIGRKYSEKGWERRFNKVLLEVQVYYFAKIKDELITTTTRTNFLAEFKSLCLTNQTFRSSIESTTKSIENYKNRYREFAITFNRAFGTSVEVPACFR